MSSNNQKPNPTSIHAAVSPEILKKADRLFSNRLSDILIELLQNARRAGAGIVQVQAEEIPTGTRISVADNGDGIQDFSALLHLGHSEWDAKTARKEDPAGMGFFSLLHSGVTVISRDQKAVIDREGFLGQKSIEVTQTETFVDGTQLIFDRAEKPADVKELLFGAARFGHLDVSFNGEAVPREDFLQGALYIKEVHGVRIGVYYDTYISAHWNFHGRTLRGWDPPELREVIADAMGKRRHLSVRVDVVEARHIHLKLPDRTDIVRDGAFVEILREAKVAMYEYLATLPEHHASFAQYQKARNLGVEIREASPLFESFHVKPAWECSDDGLLEREPAILATSIDCAIFDRYDGDAELLSFTLAVASNYFVDTPVRLIEDREAYRGYSWYDAIPRLRNLRMSINGKDCKEANLSDLLMVVDSIQLACTLVRDGQEEEHSFDLPFAALPNEDYSDEFNLVVTRSSAWTGSDADKEPFDLVDAAVYLAFRSSDDPEADSAETQLDRFVDSARSAFIAVLGGSLARARHELARALNDWSLSNALSDVGISEIRLRWVDREDGQSEWLIEFDTDPA